MPAKRQFSHRMIIPNKADGLGIADFVDDIDAAACFFDTETATSKDFFITLGVKFGKTLTELKLFAVNHNGTVGTLLAFHGIIG